MTQSPRPAKISSLVSDPSVPAQRISIRGSFFKDATTAERFRNDPSNHACCQSGVMHGPRAIRRGDEHRLAPDHLRSCIRPANSRRRSRRICPALPLAAQNDILATCLIRRRKRLVDLDKRHNLARTRSKCLADRRCRPQVDQYTTTVLPLELLLVNVLRQFVNA